MPVATCMRKGCGLFAQQIDCEGGNAIVFCSERCAAIVALSMIKNAEWKWCDLHGGWSQPNGGCGACLAAKKPKK